MATTAQPQQSMMTHAQLSSGQPGFDLASRLYRFPQQPVPPGAVCRSHRHLIRSGCLQSGSAPGTLAMCPLLTRSLDKLRRLVHVRMAGLGAQRLTLPMLGAAAIWQRTGRWESMGSEMFKLSDRQGKQLCLQPTHEEEATRLVAMAARLSSRSLPLMLYQMNWKFRDEPCPKHGLLRSREFLMKDMYSFHADEACARRTYDKVCSAYSDLLTLDLGLPAVRAVASAGQMGGTESCEFHIPVPAGEDRLTSCRSCQLPWRNVEASTSRVDDTCRQPTACQSETVAGLEVAHCFLLGRDRYPRVFNLRLVDSETAPTMSCFGIGVSRLLAACAEVASTEEALRWPLAVAPYRLVLTLPKAGAKDQLSSETAGQLIAAVASSGVSERLLVDDRDWMTIGARVRDHRLWGLPATMVAKLSPDSGGGVSGVGEKIYCELVDNYRTPGTEPLRLVVDTPGEAVEMAVKFLAEQRGAAD